ncbi:MAG: nucleotidyltransferase domain-containing protein [Myxococcota bacterium]|nr:nucleotidyltransferase domain-containing protein [Myxococcota bacterium]
MVETSDIAAEIVSRIRRRMNPQRIILFGSRGKGEARPNSDFDILVILESEKPRYKRSAPLYAELADLPIEVDAVVYTPEEVAEWRDVSESLVSTALRHGVVLYEAQT